MASSLNGPCAIQCVSVVSSRTIKDNIKLREGEVMVLLVPGGEISLCLDTQGARRQVLICRR